MIWAFTRVGDIAVRVEYECASKNCDIFLAEMDDSFKSIKIIKPD